MCHECGSSVNQVLCLKDLSQGSLKYKQAWSRLQVTARDFFFFFFASVRGTGYETDSLRGQALTLHCHNSKYLTLCMKATAFPKWKKKQMSQQLFHFLHI